MDLLLREERETLYQRENTPLLPYAQARPHSHPRPYPIPIHTPYTSILPTHPYFIPIHTPYTFSPHSRYCNLGDVTPEDRQIFKSSSHHLVYLAYLAYHA
ncbi:hypothetical protein AMTRI_Chr05g60960 [Amborella trichopoda]